MTKKISSWMVDLRKCGITLFHLFLPGGSNCFSPSVSFQKINMLTSAIVREEPPTCSLLCLKLMEMSFVEVMDSVTGVSSSDYTASCNLDGVISTLDLEPVLDEILMVGHLCALLWGSVIAIAIGFCCRRSL